MSSGIPNLYKPDYARERGQHEELKKQIVGLSGGNLTYRTVYGNHKDIVDIRKPRHEEMFEKINRKIKYKQIVRRYEVFFNQKLNKYTPQYISSLSELLTKKTKGYSNKRKDLTLKNEAFNIKSIQQPKIQLRQMFSMNNINSKRTSNEGALSLNLLKRNDFRFVRNKQRNLTIKLIEPHDDEFVQFDPKMYYDCTRVLNKLKSENRFCYSKDRKIERALKNKLISNLEDNDGVEEKVSLNKQVTWNKIKRSTSYDITPSTEQQNLNIYSRHLLHNNSNSPHVFHSKHNSVNIESTGLFTYNTGRNTLNNNSPMSRKTKLSKLNSKQLYNTNN